MSDRPHWTGLQRRLLLPLALLATVLLSASMPPSPAYADEPLATDEQAVVSADGDGLRMRSMPSLSSAVLATVPDGTIVTARGAQHRADGHCWEWVTHDSQPGWMAAEYLVRVGGAIDENADPCADAESEDDAPTPPPEPSPEGDALALPVPPPGGWTEGFAGTSDIEALVAAQGFEVKSVWLLDVATQDYHSYIVGAPDFAQSLDSTNLRADSIVLMQRTGEKPGDLGEPPAAPADVPPRVTANVLPAPPADGFTIGVSGTNDPAVLAASQDFEVRLIAVRHVPSQTWLTYIPGAPGLAQSLARGQLREDSIVWVRAGAVTTPTPEPEGTVIEARITYFYCNQGTIAAGIGDGGGFCERMRNGDIVHQGAAACSQDNYEQRQRFRIIGDPLDLTYTCKDTGSAVHGEQRDIWFDNSDDALRWIGQVGDYAQIEILPE